MARRNRAPQQDLQDLGFGGVVANDSGHRLINRDGSFAVRREHLGWRGALSLYHRLLTMRWSTYLLVLLVLFLALNALFATIYVLLGESSVSGDVLAGAPTHWWNSFFMSVHTITGVGYGNVVPAGLAANVVMTIESFLGFVFLALTTGVVFARFSRPQAAIRFSRRAVVAPYGDGAGFMFRMANGRLNELINVGASVFLSMMDETEAGTKRTFTPLALERASVAFFPLSWTVVHPMDENSPFAGLSYDDLRARDAEVLVMIESVDETFSQSVHARTSYKADEILWGAKFSNVFRRNESGTPLGVDVSAIHGVEPAEVPVPTPA